VLRSWFKHDEMAGALREELMAQVRDADLLAEWYSEHYLAIDSPGEPQVRAVLSMLEGQAAGGGVIFEFGHVPGPPNGRRDPMGGR
jgi:hypothetical protein